VLLLILALLVGSGPASPQPIPATPHRPAVVAGLTPAPHVGSVFRNLDPEYIHWGTFALAREPYDEPPTRLAAEAARRELDPHAVWILKPGDIRGW